MNESDPSARRGRNLQTLTIRREDHVGDPIAIAWLAPAETVSDTIIERLRDYLGPRVRIVKAEISRDVIEVEVETRGWTDEATRLARAARDLFQKGGKRNALSMCQEALAMDSLNADAMIAKGIILADLERDQEALDAFKHAREFGASGIEVMLAMMHCAVRLGRLGSAAQYAEEVLRLDPRNLEARRNLKAMSQGM